jgi:hypothetical protein
MKWVWWFLVMLGCFSLGALVAGVRTASCDERGCYGGMCMDSAACVPGCACISKRCS